MKIQIIISFLYTLSAGYNILIPLPCSYRSISILFHSLSVKLATSGHHVTFITTFESNVKHENLTMVLLDESAQFHFNTWQRRSDAKSGLNIVKEQVLRASEVFCQDERVRILWKERNNFDMLITDVYYNEITFVFLHEFKGVAAEVCTAGLDYQCLNKLGNKVSPSILPMVTESLLNENMNFFERIENAYNQFLYQIVMGVGIGQVTADKYYPEVGEIMRFHNTIDLTLINSHFTLDYAVPLLPNQVEIGCFDCTRLKPLPQNLKDFIDGASDVGFIYFSLGSVCKISDLPKDKVAAFVEAFRRIPQRVIMKSEIPVENLAETVLTSNWLPQFDLLSHPKAKAFISHCGIRSIHEAKYTGVPVLAMPISLDQPRIAATMAKAGQAIVLEWETISTDLIVQSIDQLVNNSAYKDNLMRVSRALQDQKESSAERAIWWIEYIIRQGGSQTITFPGKRLSFVQYFMFDILFVFLLLGFMLIIAQRYIWSKWAVVTKKNLDNLKLN